MTNTTDLDASSASLSEDQPPSSRADMVAAAKTPHVSNPIVVYEVKNGYIKEVSVKNFFQNAANTNGKRTFWIDVTVKGNLEDHTHLLEEVFTQLDHNCGAKSARFLRGHFNDSTQFHNPQAIPLVDAYAVVTRVLGTRSNDDVRHATAFCTPSAIITIVSSSNTTIPEKEENTMVSKARRALLNGNQDSVVDMLERDLPQSSVSGCILLWLSFHVQRTQTASSRLRNDVIALSYKSSADVRQVDYLEITQHKNSLLHLLSVAEEQHECVEAIAEGDAISDCVKFDDTAHMKGTLGVLRQAASSTERMLIRLEKRLADIERAYDSHQQDRINHRLNVLTIFSAVFLPLTLMAGLWGMNFSHMPELAQKNGYYWALASMAVVALSLLAFFYRNGWLR